ncbi:hypothetical protein, partial [Bacillus toyonensis]|uniref:hypothetical protein n=1 Tax=Bacillus toyonensis TaxID=155322 RepID=UPI001C3F3B0F
PQKLCNRTINSSFSFFKIVCTVTPNKSLKIFLSCIEEKCMMSTEIKNNEDMNKSIVPPCEKYICKL